MDTGKLAEPLALYKALRIFNPALAKEYEPLFRMAAYCGQHCTHWCGRAVRLRFTNTLLLLKRGAYAF
jgi:hypothetical protein